MKPYFEAQGITLYNCDCRELLPTLAPGSLGAVVTDPPYGIGFKYLSHEDNPDGYIEWLWAILEQSEDKCAPGSPIFVWQAQKNIKHFGTWFPRDWRMFISARNFTQMNRDAMPHSYEPVVVWWKEGERYVAASNEGVGALRDFHVADSAGGIHRNIKSGASAHPCPRQEDVMEFVIGNWVNSQALVFDPFTGSGTTAIACVRLGRQFIGCEIEEKYCEIAARRIERELAQGKLFEPEVTKSIQTEIPT